MLDSRDQQIIRTHAAFICQVVQAAGSADGRAELEQILEEARKNGWDALVQALRRILNGQRDLAGMVGLDAEDRVIAEAVLQGLQDPNTLPDPNQKPEPALAAPGLAGMIHAAATGDMQALVLLGQMADQMRKVGGDMTRIAGAIRPMINGERDIERLGRGMDARGRQLLEQILEELSRLEETSP
ncbi:MAG: hypothetical protein D6720_09725 [Gammaproteobacteria bacterium]|nr:MAG: hypothetical protein D6720_09725 [Gammaproteobacteria bacterium]